MSDDSSDDRAKKERSPAFPFITLQKAIERAGAMLSAHRRSPTRIVTVGETWGYKSSSSGLTQTIAALRAYGLLEDIGKGDDRRVALTPLAHRILSDAREGAREAALKEAARNPKLFAEFTDSWLHDRPSDAHCMSELTLDRGFTSDGAKAFIRILFANAAFAHLNVHDKMPSFAPSEDEDDGYQDWMSQPPEPAQRTQAPVTTTPTKPPAATLPLPEGVVSLELPSGLSERSLKALKAWLDVMVDLAAEPNKE